MKITENKINQSSSRILTFFDEERIRSVRDLQGLGITEIDLDLRFPDLFIGSRIRGKGGVIINCYYKAPSKVTPLSFGYVPNMGVIVRFQIRSNFLFDHYTVQDQPDRDGNYFQNRWVEVKKDTEIEGIVEELKKLGGRVYSPAEPSEKRPARETEFSY